MSNTSKTNKVLILKKKDQQKRRMENAKVKNNTTKISEQKLTQQNVNELLHNERKCGAYHHNENEKIEINKKIQELYNNAKSTDTQTMVINVVFHILYQSTASQATLDDINAMLTTINDDFNGKSKYFDTSRTKYTNATNDPTLPSNDEYNRLLNLSGNLNVKFQLAKNGGDNMIFYKNKTSTIAKQLRRSQDLDSIIKTKSRAHYATITTKIGKSAKTKTYRGQYLNIWVVDGLTNIKGILGYASFPWDLKRNNKTTFDYDGVVISKECFGKNPSYAQYGYGLNKTATHEIGHWMGLFHTFETANINSLYSNAIVDLNGDNKITLDEYTGDCIIDTNFQTIPTYGNPYTDVSQWKSSIRSGEKYWHMFMNFMDYSDDIAMFLLTTDQVKKIRLVMDLIRRDFITYV